MRALAQSALDAQYASELADDAEWLTGSAAPTGEDNCRIMIREVEDAFDIGGASTRLLTKQYWVRVRVSQLAALKEKDRFMIFGAEYRIAEPPVKDGSFRLEWVALCHIIGAPGG